MPPGLSGAGKYGTFIMKLVNRGCSNRPFFHMVVIKSTYPNSRHIDPLEQLGTYDPLPNAHNEKLVAVNLERVQHYLAGGVHLSRPVAQVPLAPHLFSLRYLSLLTPLPDLCLSSYSACLA